MNREECLDWLYRLRGEIYVYIQPKEWLIPMNNALDMAIKALEHPEQNVIAVVPCNDAISREWIKTAIHNFYYGLKHTPTEEDIQAYIDAAPSVSTEKIGRCKDCKYFERDSVAKVYGTPIIVAHEICSRWGSGCKTREDGYCFLYEPQESEE